MKNSIKIFFFLSLFVVVGTYANISNKTISSEQITSTFKEEISSLCKAAMQGDVEKVRSLIALGEELNKKSLGLTPAMYAARYNRAEVLKVLLLNGANLNIKSDKGYTAKEYATMSNATDVLAVIDKNS
ncbi:Ankyrin repeat-containing protein [Maribacter orientalis]|uniref:Ankyrin repeat-containing protein n=1 Tax=Maribacter orientalis TaxID=228957 RepID=A0A1H7VHL7_9FLAO|nr:ankyrin repeat domain-containing protein [Maribacter orientalis]SEM08544.1 Ankyrin repeat-containing protein [Maribacter orientalis]|tara:strand:- start:199 stop:585 length:387 start_codon:yes stop_codon:yes gene_type:complete